MMADLQFPEAERIQLLLDHFQEKQCAFETDCGLARATIYKVMHSGSLTRETAIRICKRHPEVNLAWLVSGEGEPFRSKEEQQNVELAVQVSRLASAVERLCAILDKNNVLV